MTPNEAILRCVRRLESQELSDAAFTIDVPAVILGVMINILTGRIVNNIRTDILIEHSYLRNIVKVAPNVVSNRRYLFGKFINSHTGKDLLFLPDGEAIGVNKYTVDTLEGAGDGGEVTEGAWCELC